MNLKNITIGVSGLTGEIYLYRHGKNDSRPLDKRNAEQDVMAAFVTHMMHNNPEGSSKTVWFGSSAFRLICEPTKEKRKVK